MHTKLTMTITALAIALAATAGACGGDSGKTGKTGSNLKGNVESQKAAITAAKPAAANKVMTPPKAIPAAKMALASEGRPAAMVTPPDPMVGEVDGDESYEITAAANIDLDGDGDGDAATVLVDDETRTLYIWF